MHILARHFRTFNAHRKVETFEKISSRNKTKDPSDTCVTVRVERHLR